MTAIRLIISTQVWCDLEVKLHHLHSVTATGVLGCSITCCRNKHRAKNCQPVQQHKAPQATTFGDCHQNKKSMTSIDKNCTMKMTMHSTLIRIPSQGHEFHCVAWSYMVFTYLSCSSKSGELKQPYADWKHSLSIEGANKENVHKSKAMLSHGRQESNILQTKIHTYSSAWSHAYSCLHGGEEQFRSQCLSKRNHSSIGTRWFGCTTVVHIRLLEVINCMKIFEIQIPMISTYLSAHNSSLVTDQFTVTPFPQTEEKFAELVQECFLSKLGGKVSAKLDLK